jgi:hypothetical protein
LGVVNTCWGFNFSLVLIEQWVNLLLASLVVCYL